MSQHSTLIPHLRELGSELFHACPVIWAPLCGASAPTWNEEKRLPVARLPNALSSEGSPISVPQALGPQADLGDSKCC